jgi:hypothetical protein
LLPAVVAVFLEQFEAFVIECRLIPVVLGEEIVHGPFPAGGKDVVGDALDGLVPGGDQAGDVGFCVATLVMGQRVEPVDGVGAGQEVRQRHHGMAEPPVAGLLNPRQPRS